MVETEIQLQRYESYKDSGVEWVGEIPEHWELKRFKHIFKEKKASSNLDLNCGSISFGKVVFKDDEKVTESTKRSYQVLNKGEFLINPLNLNYDLISLRIALSDKDVVVSSGYIIVQDIIELSKDYYKSLLHVFDVAFMKTLGAGVRQTLNFNLIANTEFIFPPLEEQTVIAQFLDDKTTKIDSAIAIKEQQINLLKERKQILINKAVTQGLNPNVKLKDSGVEWIGEIPEYWEVRRFKFLCDITTGSKNTENKVENGLYPFYVRSQTPERINSYTFDGEAILTAGDGAGVGKVFHYVNEKFDFHQRVYKFSNFKNIKGKLLFYFLRSNFHSVALNGEAKSTVDSLRLPLIQNFMVTVPPRNEQIEIIKKIETASQKIETAISLKQHEIEKLKEYKGSLINSCVTGKVKVC
ncbi:restriction endonuclease subunit S [Aequorivita viscosa]|nr:restriction endonuclease subunit S [Aequorivita viscosa]